MTSLRRLLILAALASPLLAAAPAAADTFTNSAPIAIPGTGSSGPASPYPSALRVTGMTGPVTDVNVTFHKTGHRFPREIRAVLVSPGGRVTDCEIEHSTVDDWGQIPAYKTSLIKALGEDGASHLAGDVLPRLPGFHASARQLHRNLMNIVGSGRP